MLVTFEGLMPPFDAVASFNEGAKLVAVVVALLPDTTVVIVVV